MKKVITFILLIVTSSFAYSQNLENVNKKNPVVIHGNIGAAGNYYTSNEAVASRPPWMLSTYGNFNPVVYGISMPVSFAINQFGSSFKQPFAQFGISPTYKWAKLHLGVRSIQMSPLVFDGQSFRGVGLELNPKALRFAAFYGKLNRTVNEDTTSGKYAAPQFSRIGYGVKIGVGKENNFFDLIYFHAKDDSTSAELINKNKIHSQENSVIAASFKITPIKKIIWSADLAISGLTKDLSDSTGTDSITGIEKFFSELMPVSNSTVVSYGGQSTLNFRSKMYNTTLGYRRVQPDFKSLGTPYMLNDIELINWLNNFNLLESKLNINTSISNQHNNLKKNLTSEMNTFVSNLNVNASLTSMFNINFNYSGYMLTQKDGTAALNDSARLNQQIHQLNISPSYTILQKTKSHTISGNANYMLLDDKNPVTSPFTSSNNLSTSLNYTLGLTSKSMNVTIGGLFTQYNQGDISYKSSGVTLGSSAQLLKNKNLSLQGSAGYIANRSSLKNAQSNLTFSANVGYNVKHHSLNFFANYIYTPYNPINDVISKALRQIVASKNLAAGISYNYSF